MERGPGIIVFGKKFSLQPLGLFSMEEIITGISEGIKYFLLGIFYLKCMNWD